MGVQFVSVSLGIERNRLGYPQMAMTVAMKQGGQRSGIDGGAPPEPKRSVDLPVTLFPVCQFNLQGE